MSKNLGRQHLGLDTPPALEPAQNCQDVIGGIITGQIAICCVMYKVKKKTPRLVVLLIQLFLSPPTKSHVYRGSNHKRGTVIADL